jgi:hypothetical protein
MEYSQAKTQGFSVYSQPKGSGYATESKLASWTKNSEIVLSLQRAIEGSNLKSCWPQIAQFVDEANNNDTSSISLESLKEDFEGENF